MLRRNAVSQTVTNFDPSNEFLELVTEAYVAAMALKKLGLRSAADTIAAPPEERHITLIDLSVEIVRRCNRTPDIGAVVDRILLQNPHCRCHEDKGGEIVVCENGKCGLWHHTQCN